MNAWYTDLILSNDNPSPTLQVRWTCTADQAKACAPFIEHVAKMEFVELIYHGTSEEGDLYTNWFVAGMINPSLGDVMKYVDQGIHAYQESTKTDDDSDWVGLL